MECGDSGQEDRQLNHVEEAVEIRNIVKRILQGDHAQAGKEYPRFKLIVRETSHPGSHIAQTV